MRLIAMLFALVLSVPAFACEQVPAELRVRSMTGDFMTINGDMTLKIELIDMDRAECEVENRVATIKNGARVSFMAKGSNKVLQSYEADVAALLGQLIISKPAALNAAGIEVGLTSKKEIFVLFDKAAIRPSVVR